MLDFRNDYAEGAHPAVLQRLIETNAEQLPGYGSDRYSTSARHKIAQACASPDADVFLLVGGTQTNQVVIAAMLRLFQGVIAAPSGHINVHEAGAVEATGHKVITLDGQDCPQGKIGAQALRNYLQRFHDDENHEHMVFPGLVYITHPTEFGTLYTLDELEAISRACHEFGVPLYLDGARLGYALATPGSDVTLEDVARLCDAFYIGGTKVGALCGEAVVFPHGNAPEHFLTMVKQHGALLAKGRLTGVQFDALFTDNLYLSISRNAIEMADLLRAAFRAKGYEFAIDSPTNQIFIALDEATKNRLGQQVLFDFWERRNDGRTVVRFATSWATTRLAVDQLIAML